MNLFLWHLAHIGSFINASTVKVAKKIVSEMHLLLMTLCITLGVQSVKAPNRMSMSSWCVMSKHYEQ